VQKQKQKAKAKSKSKKQKLNADKRGSGRREDTPAGSRFFWAKMALSSAQIFAGIICLAWEKLRGMLPRPVTDE
jgi:hypothetical protein